MRIEFNYKKENFVQIFPVFYITNGNENVILIGLGYINIAFIFGNNIKSIYDKVGKTDGNLNEFVFIWYKKMQNGDKTHYTEPFRTVVKANNREEAVEQLTQFALKKMTLCIHDEANFIRSDYSKIQEDFHYMNRAMKDMENKFKNIKNRYS